MVRGLSLFRDYFEEYRENYVLIGGAACDLWMDSQGLTFRATKDLDIVLIVEALSGAFIEKFWDFVREGGYSTHQKSTGENTYYRFKKPENEDYPSMLELFSRKIDDFPLFEGSHLTPVPAEDGISSLSAILMNDEYYHLIISERREINSVPCVSPLGLICLKAKAYLELNGLKAAGERIDRGSIKKHKNDVFRIAFTLSEDDRIVVQSSIGDDMNEFIDKMASDPPDVRALSESMGVPQIDRDTLISVIRGSIVIGESPQPPAAPLS